MTSPPASITTRVATAAASSTSCVATIAAPPSARVRGGTAPAGPSRRGRARAWARPAAAAGALGRGDRRGRDQEALAGGEVARVTRGELGDPERARATARRRPGVARGRAASRAPRARTVSANRIASGSCGQSAASTPGRGGAAEDRDRAGRGRRGRPAMRAAASTCRRRCVPSRRRSRPRARAGRRRGAPGGRRSAAVRPSDLGHDARRRRVDASGGRRRRRASRAARRRARRGR